MAGFRNNGTCVSNIRGKVELIRLLSWSKKLSGSFRINLSDVIKISSLAIPMCGCLALYSR